MRTTTKRVVNNHKHKRCMTRIIKIKIMTTKKVGIQRVGNSYSEDRREGRRRST
jgi:hypothetical protein